MKVLLLLTPLFLLVGFWLYYYSRRRSQLVQDFSAKKGLRYFGVDDGGFEEQLSADLALEPPLARSFARIRDITDADGILLFRVTEVLDLSHYGLPQNSHFGRLAVSFEVSSPADIYFLARGQNQFRPIVPDSVDKISTEPAFKVIAQVISIFPPPHSLSVTLVKGRFLAYLEPAVVGSEKEPELEYLLLLAQRIRRKLK